MSLYIAAHKALAMPESRLYRPLALGGADLGIAAVADNVGDNISHLNPYYCELTGTYWLWKNCQDDFIGLCHYRRYFNLLPIANNKSVLSIRNEAGAKALLEHPRQKEAVVKLLDRYDLILPRAIYLAEPMPKRYKKAHGSREWEVFMSSLDMLYGRNSHSLDVERRFFVGNMIICKKDLFHRYAEQLFSVINRVFDSVGILEPRAGKRYQPYRYPGYLGERFTSAFINANRLSYFEAQLLVMA